MADETYRYLLTRRGWLGGHGRVLWVMLNPSTADEHTDDPTVRRVVGFTQYAGYAACHVVNLFAVRATDPDEMAGLARLGLDVVGPGNIEYLSREIRSATAVVLAWGSSVPSSLAADASAQRALVLELCRQHGQIPLCLGVNQDGQPKHPLYIAKATPLVRYATEARV